MLFYLICLLLALIAVSEYVAETQTDEQSIDSNLRSLDPKEMPGWCSGYPQ